jgi:serine phosphatase RsbU (regulator of sigma subunit)
MVSSLYVEVPGELPFEVRLDKDVVTVGRAEENVLGLRDMNVSRAHFIVERRENTWIVRDKGSRNGTLVNKAPVQEKVLLDGDRIEVGGSTLTFKAQASRLSVSTAEAPRPKPGPQLRESSLQPGIGPPQPALVAAGKPPPAPQPPVQPPPIGVFAAPRPTTVAMPAAEPAPPPPRPAPPPQPPVPTPSTPPTSVPRVVTPAPSVTPAPPGTPLPRTVAPRATAPIPPQPAAQPVSPERTVPMGARNLGPVADLIEKNRPVSGPRAPAHRWKMLAELMALINQERDLARLLERIVDAVLSLVPARGAFLVTAQGESLELKVARNFDATKLGDPNGVYRLSYQTAREAIESKRPILTKDAGADSHLRGFESISNLQLKAILCVPFGYGGEMMGVVYLDEPVIEKDAGTDVIDLVSAFGDLAGIAFANARHLEEAKRRERLSEELKIASRIQRKLLPETAPLIQGLEIAGRTIPAEEVGGDLYDFFVAPSGELFISVGDVSGKGAGAGIVMASTRALLRAYCEREGRTDKLLVALNRALVRDLEKGSFVSLLLLRWSPATRTIAYAGAGHEHLLVQRARTGAIERLRSGGTVLGLSPDLEGRVEEKPLELEPGDQVVLYTDGATEAASPEGEELGLDRLVAIVSEARGRAPKDMVEHVIGRVHAFAGVGHPPRDDLTVVALRRS